MQDVIGRVIGHHEMRERLGGGAMGDVYRGLHVGLEQDRAIKILAPDLARDPIHVSLFAREARVAAGLRHPNVVQIHDVGTDQGFQYIAMELLEGQALNRVLARHRGFSVAEALPLLRQLAAALDYAHDRGVIHRDIKPSNVMIGSDGHLTLVDFGIARASESTGMTQTRTSGTPYYMAPEVWRGEGGTRASDLYALGVLTFELLVGRVPFSGPTQVAVMHAHIYEPAPSPRTLGSDLPSAVESVLLRLLAKEPDARYASAGDFVADLERAAALGERVRVAQAALAAGDITRARAAVDAVAAEAPADPDVLGLQRALAAQSEQAHLLAATRSLTDDGLPSSEAGYAETHVLANRSERASGLPVPPPARVLTSDETRASQPRRSIARVLLFAAPVMALVLLGAAYLLVGRSEGSGTSDASAVVAPATPTAVPSATVVPTAVPAPPTAVAVQPPPSTPTAVPPTPVPPTPTAPRPTPTSEPPTPTAVPPTPIPALASGPPGTVLLSDDFDDPAKGKLAREGYEAGEYTLRRPPGELTRWLTLPWDLPNVSVAVDARIPGDPKDVRASLSCRSNLPQGGVLRGSGRYELFVQPEGQRAWLRVLHEGNEPVSIPPTRDRELPMVNAGNATNRLELHCSGDTITALVNGQEIATIKDGRFPNGKLQLQVSRQSVTSLSPPSEVRFDNLVVTQR